MDADTLLPAVRRSVADLGFELIEFRQSGPPQRHAIQVRIDRPESAPGRGVTAEDCARTSRALERVFDGAFGPAARYSLEVSSPGIERPVRFPEHWQRYVGRTVRLTARSLPGRPRAVILALPDEHHVRVRLPNGSESVLALADVNQALLQDESVASGHREP